MQITETAAQELKKLKEQIQPERPGNVPRLVRGDREGQFRLVLDSPKEGDEPLYYADEPVLVVDAETSQALADITLDCKETPQGRALVMEGPA